MKLRTEKTGDVLVVEVDGSYLDASVSEAFKREIAPHLKAGANVVVGLGNLQLIDSSGIGAILWCLHQLQAVGGALKLCEVSGPVHHALELTRMHRILDIVQTRPEAIASFEAAG